MFVPPRGWQRHVGKRLADLFDAGCDWLVRKTKRKPREADEDDVELFGDALGAQVTIWTPNAALSPGAIACLTGGFILADKFIGAEKIGAPAAAPAAPTVIAPAMTAPAAGGAPTNGVPVHAAAMSTPRPEPPPTAPPPTEREAEGIPAAAGADPNWESGLG